ncbi:MAG: FkbM family methyltransferase [Candidatus Altiarchaeales archaeon]|nr:FkbM family methyltransferase [Candidatus Altiarchaeales archaeon]MBD3415530.1 FkbM family methyltransferase [Candidatus Altiarchaeales archaeon]
MSGMGSNGWRKNMKNLLKVGFGDVIRAYAEEADDFFFVEVGAYDGIKGDCTHRYIREYGWRGIMVEASARNFEKLKENYEKDDRIILENAAISDRTGTCKLYRLERDSESYGLNYSMLGSVEYGFALKLKSLPENREYNITTEEVNCMTLDDLLRKHDVKKIDLLQIDIEGHDYAVINSIDFKTVKPNIIYYESEHMRPDEHADCIRMLEENGYTVRQTDLCNCIAVLHPERLRPWNILKARIKCLIRRVRERIWGGEG